MSKIKNMIFDTAENLSFKYSKMNLSEDELYNVWDNELSYEQKEAFMMLGVTDKFEFAMEVLA
tara:strand:+ start:3579 stop:3767 length:189 start_codon:yes stop_codon:yes gene_type:complete